MVCRFGVRLKESLLWFDRFKWDDVVCEVHRIHTVLRTRSYALFQTSMSSLFAGLQQTHYFRMTTNTMLQDEQLTRVAMHVTLIVLGTHSNGTSFQIGLPLYSSCCTSSPFSSLNIFPLLSADNKTRTHSHNTGLMPPRSSHHHCIKVLSGHIYITRTRGSCFKCIRDAFACHAYLIFR